jgi:hypothetical protein
VTKRSQPPKEQYRFGIGEWYGGSFIHLTPQKRRYFAHIQHIKKKLRPSQACPPRLAENPQAQCTKDGGICSLRLYKLSHQSVNIVSGDLGGLVTTCPYRFNEEMKVFHWVGETILGHSQPIIVNEIGFLERPKELAGNGPGADDVGRIDMVLVNPDQEPLSWCAMEIQAVYFSGDSMKKEFELLFGYGLETLPFPAGRRRPDYRSSGPKRLMPQLQIKVPTLRRWGKKMAVVIDRSFFNAIGEMGQVDDLSNCDIAWFVVRYREEGTQAILEPDFVRFTTLERTVEGLTGGMPISLNEFERIKQKLKKFRDAPVR